MMRALAILIVTILFGTTIGHAERIDHIAGLAPADHFKIDSESTTRPYHIFVRLPEGYETSTQDYPTVYALDGDITFPILGPYHLLFSYDEPVPDAIIVGINYGTFRPDEGNFRTVDFSTPPLPDEFRQGVDQGAPNGGAAAFQNFIRTELIPLVEKKYRADATKRIIVGQSRGAHFVLYSAISDPDLFWGHIASNPSLEPNKEFFFQDLGTKEKTASKVFFSSASRDFPRLRKSALELFENWSGQSRKPWDLKTVTLEGETHAAGITNVYRAAMIWFFDKDTNSTEPSIPSSSTDNN